MRRASIASHGAPDRVPAHVWIEAARPRTLAAAVSPVLVGTAAARSFIAWRAIAALAVALALQVAVNLANDYFDAARGVDTGARVGPRRVTAAGLVPPGRMRLAIAISLAIAVVAGLSLTVAVGPELLVVGVLCVAAALGYSGGPRPYGSSALGEVFVFLFFGLVATLGSQYVQDQRVTLDAVVAAGAVGSLATAILVVNNARDLESDRAAGKTTLAVVLGRRRTRHLYRALTLAAFLLVPAIAIAAESAWPLVALAALPLAIKPLRLVSSTEPSLLVEGLGATAGLHLAFGVLLAVGLWIA